MVKSSSASFSFGSGGYKDYAPTTDPNVALLEEDLWSYLFRNPFTLPFKLIYLILACCINLFYNFLLLPCVNISWPVFSVLWQVLCFLFEVLHSGFDLVLLGFEQLWLVIQVCYRYTLLPLGDFLGQYVLAPLCSFFNYEWRSRVWECVQAVLSFLDTSLFSPLGSWFSQWLFTPLHSYVIAPFSIWLQTTAPLVFAYAKAVLTFPFKLICAAGAALLEQLRSLFELCSPLLETLWSWICFVFQGLCDVCLVIAKYQRDTFIKTWQEWLSAWQQIGHLAQTHLLKPLYTFAYSMGKQLVFFFTELFTVLRSYYLAFEAACDDARRALQSWLDELVLQISDMTIVQYLQYIQTQTQTLIIAALRAVGNTFVKVLTTLWHGVRSLPSLWYDYRFDFVYNGDYGLAFDIGTRVQLQNSDSDAATSFTPFEVHRQAQREKPLEAAIMLRNRHPSLQANCELYINDVLIGIYRLRGGDSVYPVHKVQVPEPGSQAKIRAVFFTEDGQAKTGGRYRCGERRHTRPNEPGGPPPPQHPSSVQAACLTVDDDHPHTVTASIAWRS